MSRERLSSTAAFRLVAFYAGLFTVSAVALTVLIFFGISHALETRARRAVRDEFVALAARFDSGGREGLRDFVADLARRGPTGFVYAYIDRQGHLLAGDEAVPTDARPGWLRFESVPLGHVTEAQAFLGYAAPLGDDLLVVGRDIDEIDDFQELLLVGSTWTVIATILLAIGGGLLVSRFTLRRIGAVTETTARIIAGDLTRRVPLSGSGDEFDRLAAQINATLDRLAQLMDGMREVSNDIAHELRTPLGRLKGHLEETLRRSETAEEQRQAIAYALGQTDTILDTFRALLRIAEIESGSRRAGFRAVELSRLVDGLVESYAAVAEDRGQTLLASIEPDVRVQGDPELLTQALVNLVENALRHAPPGATVRVSLAVPAARIEITVADDGPGIAAADRERVLRRFVRLEASRASPGSGLGLSLVAAVAELHGIEVGLGDNRPGLVITLRFPNHDKPGVPRQNASAMPEYPRP